MILKKIFSLFFFGFLILILFFQNSEVLVQKIFELRQSYIIEKSDCLTTFEFSKKEYFSLKDKKEFIVNGKYYDVKNTIHLKNTVKLIVIEDKNESFIKYISFCLKKESSEKNTEKFKHEIKFVLYLKEKDSKKFVFINKASEKFYLKENKYNQVILSLLKPPIV